MTAKEITKLKMAERLEKGEMKIKEAAKYSYTIYQTDNKDQGKGEKVWYGSSNTQ